MKNILVLTISLMYVTHFAKICYIQKRVYKSDKRTFFFLGSFSKAYCQLLNINKRNVRTNRSRQIHLHATSLFYIFFFFCYFFFPSSFYLSNTLYQYQFNNVHFVHVLLKNLLTYYIINDFLDYFLYLNEDM